MRSFLALVVVSTSFFGAVGQSTENLRAYKRVLSLMGSRFEISAVAKSEQEANRAIDAGVAEITRIEKLISSWDPNSQTSKINRFAGVEPVTVSEELYNLIFRSIKVSKLTNGAFDISYAAIDKIWKFDGTMTKPPSQEQISASVSKINFEHITLNPSSQSVFLKEKGMKIGFGAIGKGYAANRAKMVMMSLGIESGVVNASGDLITWGKQETGSAWRVGIANPKNIEKVFSWLSVENMSVVTSGNYEKFFMHEGRRYSHIINPKTGYPTTGIKSVTIVCPDAELGDALATSVFVMGKQGGLQLINNLKGIECLIITDEDEIVTSENLELNYYDGSANQSKDYNYKVGG